MNPKLIALTAVVSSQIAAIGYDPESQILAVQFIETGAEGRVYHYHGFPPEKFAELEAAESKGSFFYKHIKNRYDFDRFEADGTLNKSVAATLPPTAPEEKAAPGEPSSTDPGATEPAQEGAGQAEEQGTTAEAGTAEQAQEESDPEPQAA
jgi:hypothetical protein